MIEQMENLDDFSADYFIAKGPLEKLGSQLSDLISGIENHQGPPPQEKRILHTGGVFPRREAIELLQSLEFHRSVIEALGSGVIVLDHDTRVIHANEAAKTILGKSDEEIINGSILALFPKSRISQLVSALKTTARGGEAAHGSFFVGINGRVARAVISSIKAEQAAIGWVVALEGITG
jgi:PAS domain S-box-containing protein